MRRLICGLLLMLAATPAVGLRQQPDDAKSSELIQEIDPEAIELFNKGWSLINEAKDEGSIKRGLNLCTEAAELGHARAAYYLHAVYSLGEKVLPNKELADHWLEVSAELGSPWGQWAYGMRLVEGDFNSHEPADGLPYLIAAADADISFFQYELALLLGRGGVLPRDIDAAVGWMKRSAESGWVPAMVGYGSLFRDGTGVEQDIDEAMGWYRRAADQGSADAMTRISLLYQLGEHVEANQEEALEWRRRAAETGDPDSQFFYALALSSGSLGHKDVRTAFEWLERAAMQGHVGAMSHLASAHYIGVGTPKDLVQAHVWHNIAAAFGSDTDAELRDLQERLSMNRDQVSQAQAIAAILFSEIDQSGRNQDEEPGARLPATGSGFFVTTDGYFVTNTHVVGSSEKVEVTINYVPRAAEIIALDADSDLALLRVDVESVPLPIANAGTISAGSSVATLGFPNPALQGVEAKFASGEVASLTGAANESWIVQISVPVQSGNSGGPLFDRSGAVQGVIVGRLSDGFAADAGALRPENVSYAISLSALRAFLDRNGVAYTSPEDAETSSTDWTSTVKMVTPSIGMVIAR